MKQPLDVGVTVETECSGGGGLERRKSKWHGRALVGRGDLVSLDGDLAKDDFGEEGLLGGRGFSGWQKVRKSHLEMVFSTVASLASSE